MKTAKLQIPPLSTRKVWIGSYGGHFDVIVVFSKKPKKSGKDSWRPGIYCTLLNENIIAGTFDMDQFNEWFGTSIKPTDTDIIKVEAYNLTAVWDEFNQIVGLNTNVDMVFRNG